MSMFDYVAHISIFVAMIIFGVCIIVANWKNHDCDRKGMNMLMAMLLIGVFGYMLVLFLDCHFNLFDFLK